MTNKTKTNGPDLAERIALSVQDAVMSNKEASVGEAGKRAMQAVRDLAAPIEAELAELRKMAEWLPKTADGTRIVPGIKLWAGGCQWTASYLNSYFVKVFRADENGQEETRFFNPHWVYSTEAAMMAAKPARAREERDA